MKLGVDRVTSISVQSSYVPLQTFDTRDAASSSRIDDATSGVESGKHDDGTDSLFETVYFDLRRLARSLRRRRRRDMTMSTTALVHESYLKLAKHGELHWHNRAHFFATVAKVMRQVLASYAERSSALKRGGAERPIPFEEHLFPGRGDADEALAIHHAIARLECDQPRVGRVLECRIFGGLTIQETAQALSISPATVKRDWCAGTAWLSVELGIEK